MSAQLVVFCKHRLSRVSKFDFLVIQPASVKFPMNILMLFHDFRNIGRPSDFPGFGCQRLTPSWSGLLLKDASSERNQCLALCKLNQVGINICPKTMLKVTVWRHMISSWFWNPCCCELLFPPTIMSESGGGDGKLMLETTSVFAGSPRQSSATSKWWSASFNSTTQPWHSCQFGFMTHHPKNSVMPFWLKHLQPTSWGADMCNRLPVVLSIDNLRHEPKKSRSRV